MENAKDLVREQYGSVGDAYVRSVGHATGNDIGRMLELSAPQATETMLDIATGGGHVARVFAPHVSRVIASDLAPEILKHAGDSFAEKGLSDIELVEADAEALPFDDESFEIVTCRIAPHHFPNLARFVSEVARVLKPGSQFLLIDSTMPAGEGGDFYNRFEKIRDHSHLRSLPIEEWSEMLRAEGLGVTTVESFQKKHDFADWVERSRTSEEDIAALSKLMHSASEEQKALFSVEFEGDVMQSFSDTKTLFRAIKSDS